MVHLSPATAKRKLFWVILFNLGITVAELIGGWITGYLALLADAVHNLSDVGALLLAWFGIKSGERPASKRTTYGLKRVEVMTALVSAVTLVAIAFLIFIEAIQRFMAPQEITEPGIFLTVALVGLVGNLSSIYMLHSGRHSSLNLRAAWLHMTFDALSSVGVIVGGLIIWATDWVIIDPVLSILIGSMILWSSYRVIKEAVLVLLEAVPPGIDFDQVCNEIGRVPKVKGVHDLHIWSISSTEIALSCHVLLDQSDYSDGPDVIIAVNRMLAQKFTITHSTIQIEKASAYRCINDSTGQPHLWE